MMARLRRKDSDSFVAGNHPQETILQEYFRLTGTGHMLHRNSLLQLAGAQEAPLFSASTLNSIAAAKNSSSNTSTDNSTVNSSVSANPLLSAFGGVAAAKNSSDNSSDANKTAGGGFGGLFGALGGKNSSDANDTSDANKTSGGGLFGGLFGGGSDANNTVSGGLFNDTSVSVQVSGGLFGGAFHSGGKKAVSYKILRPYSKFSKTI
jgi:hypothetical protein